ncbi:MAG: hypothetical protein Kow0063_44200 [Anaerolineae bacterium]
MQRPIFARRPLPLVAMPELPPMYDWPRPVKWAIMSACIILCLVFYTAMAGGIISLASLVLGLV